MAKGSKKTKTTPDYDSGRETRVLLEQIRNDVKVVAQQHGSIKEDIKEFKNSVNHRFDRVEVALMENSRDIKANSRDIRANNIAIKANSRDIKANSVGIKANSRDIKASSIGIKANSYNLKKIEHKLDQSLDNHEKRIQKVEERVGIL
ncbi:MAG: hypothetical protein KKF54_06655 [Candidatus Omnitrophica bacterium]|nr:hypothetical protein [Candidatus Omnitrophota bacterium]